LERVGEGEGVEEGQSNFVLFTELTINKLRRIKWEKCVDRMRETRNPLNTLLINHEEKIQLVRPPSGWFQIGSHRDEVE
jgi:hypothetical protein